MRTPTARRGEVWADAEGVEMLVISIDSFNRGRMDAVECLAVYDGDRSDEPGSAYAAVVEVEGEQRTVFFDDLFLAPKADLVEVRWKAPDELLDEAGSALREILSPQAATDPEPAAPSRFPQTGEIRFADLHIEGETDKPVVVISSEEYSRLVGHVFVVACRVTSNVTKVREFDVKLRSQTGKVVCSHIQAVPLSDITYRSTPASHVTPR
ncbi:hypothetical protein GCM10027062_35840 [Nocardioides hungaricus]